MENGESFRRGERKEKLDRVARDVVEIKGDIKEMGKKVDEVEKSADRAAVKADNAARKADEQKETGTARYKENKEKIDSIKTTVEGIAKKQTETDGRVAKIYTVAAVIGGGAGLFLPWIKDYFFQ